MATAGAPSTKCPIGKDFCTPSPRSPHLQETAETAYISTTWRPPKQKPCGSEEIGLGRALVLLEFQGSAAPARPNLWKSDRPRWKLGLAAPWSCTNRPAEMGNGPGRSLKSAVREPNPFKASRLVRFSHSSPSVLGFWKVGPAGAALVAICGLRAGNWARRSSLIKMPDRRRFFSLLFRPNLILEPQ